MTYIRPISELIQEDVWKELGTTNSDWFNSLTKKCLEEYDNYRDLRPPIRQESGKKSSDFVPATCRLFCDENPVLSPIIDKHQPCNSRKGSTSDQDSPMHLHTKANDLEDFPTPTFSRGPTSFITPLSAIMRRHGSGHLFLESPLLSGEKSTPPSTKMARALGVDDESNISWTESLATPSLVLTSTMLPKEPVLNTKLEGKYESGSPSENLGAARKLFTAECMSAGTVAETSCLNADDTMEEIREAFIGEVHVDTTREDCFEGGVRTPKQEVPEKKQPESIPKFEARRIDKDIEAVHTTTVRCTNTNFSSVVTSVEKVGRDAGDPEPLEDILSLFFSSPPSTRNHIKKASSMPREQRDGSNVTIHDNGNQISGPSTANVVEGAVTFVNLEHTNCNSKSLTPADAVSQELFYSLSPSTKHTVQNVTDRDETSGVFSLPRPAIQNNDNSIFEASTICESSKQETVQSTTVPLKTEPRTPYRHVGDDELFSQISPTVLDCLLKVTATSTPMSKPRSSHVNTMDDSSSRHNGNTPVRWKEQNPAVELTPDFKTKSPQKTSAKRTIATRKGLGLKKNKIQRFSYPTSSQVGTVCPEAVLKLNPSDKWRIVSTSCVPDHHNGSGDQKGGVALLGAHTSVSSDLAAGVKPCERGDGPDVVPPDTNRHKKFKASGFTSLSSYDREYENDGLTELEQSPCKAKETYTKPHDCDGTVSAVCGTVSSSFEASIHIGGAKCILGSNDKICSKNIPGFSPKVTNHPEHTKRNHSPTSRIPVESHLPIVARKSPAIGSLPEITLAFGGFQSDTGKNIDSTGKSLRGTLKLIEEVQDVQQAAIESGNLNASKETILSTTCVKNSAKLRPNRTKSAVEKNQFKSDKQEDNVGFHSASGKNLSVSRDALLKAESLLTDVCKMTEAPDDNSAQSGRFEEADLICTTMKNSMASESKVPQYDSIQNSKPLTGKRLRNTAINQHNSAKTAKDYSKVPKGFRPFKRPRLSVESAGNVHQKIDPKYEFSSRGPVGYIALPPDHSDTGKEETVMPHHQLDLPRDHLSSTQLEEVKETLNMLKHDHVLSQNDFPLNVASVLGNPQNTSRPFETENIENNLQIRNRSLASEGPVEYSTGVSAAPAPGFGFTTASGTSVSVSNEALSRARTMLADSPTDTPPQPTRSTAGIHGDISQPGHESHTTQGNIGFITAGGGRVSVSKTALSRARQLLASVDRGEEAGSSSGTSQSSTDTQVVPSCPQLQAATESHGGMPKPGSDIPNKTMGGFMTAGGNKVTVTKEAMERARQVLDNVQNNDRCETAGGIYANLLTPSTGLMGGFIPTAGHTVTASSEEEMSNARKVQSCEENDGCGYAGTSHVNRTVPTVTRREFGGIHTANDSNVSENALKLARSPVDGTSDNIPVTAETNATKLGDVNRKACANQKPADFTGFHTARGASVYISKESLRHAKSLIDEDNSNTDNIQMTVQRTMIELDYVQVTSTVNQAPAGFSGFQTASGGSVSVTAESLKRAKSLFEDNSPMGIQSNTIMPNIQVKPSVDQNPVGLSGFQTVCGTSVHAPVPEESLKCGNSVFDKDSLANHIPVTGQKNATRLNDIQVKSSARGSRFAGFQTGRGVSVSVTEESLKCVKSLFNEDSLEPKPGTHRQADICGVQSSVKQYDFSGFQTGRGVSVSVSEESLKRVKSLFDEDSVKVDTGQHRQPEVSGFQTSHRNKVSVSEKSFVTEENAKISSLQSGDGKSGKRHFVDDSFPFKKVQGHVAARQQDSSVLVQSGTTCFQTGRGANIVMSKEALDKAREVISEGECVAASKPNRLTGSELPSKIERVTKRAGEDADLTVEAYESAKALLADGDFGALFNGDDDSKHMELTSKTKSWMQPHYSSPDEWLRDRKVTEKTISLQAQHTLPSSQTKYSVTPKKLSYKAVNALVNSRHDRQGFSLSLGMPPGPGEKHLEHHDLAGAVATSFTTPFKGIPQTDSQHPTKDTNNTGHAPSNFHTPYKQEAAAGSFRAPVKARPLTESVQHSSSPESDEPVGRQERSEDTIAENGVQVLQTTARPVVSTEVQKSRLKTKVAQAMRIKEKKTRGDTRPVPGEMITQRGRGTTNPLPTAVGGTTPSSYTNEQLLALGVRPSTLLVRAGTAGSYRFLAEEHYPRHVVAAADGVRAGDGAFLVLADDSTIGREEFCNALFDLAGVEPKLISRDWVYNHYRWITWKLAALEASFPTQFAGRSLTPDNVMLQLKYRYDREIDLSQRSALKKIYEKDDSPQKPMILCVSAVQSPMEPAAGAEQGDGGPVTMELTDGWYRITATIDQPLTRLVQRTKIGVGDKLFIYGAEMLGSEEGCPPLEAPADTMLRIACNSTRRARWDARLGFCHNLRPPCLPITSLYPDGGIVGCVDIVVARVFPVQYFEKRSDGVNIFRGERGEEKAAQLYEKERQKMLEKLNAKMEADFEKKSRMTQGKPNTSNNQLSIGALKSLDSGPEIYQAWQQAPDPDGFESCLSMRQMDALGVFRRRAQEDQHADLQEEFRRQLEDFEALNPKRNVVPLLKVKVVGCHTKDIDNNLSTMFTVWRPTSDVRETIVEGKRLKLFNISTGDNRARNNTCTVSLSATRSTQYHPVSCDPNFLDLVFLPREVTSFCELREGFTPPHGELDIVGTVLHVSSMSEFDRPGGESGCVQTVYLADVDFNFAALKFWGGVKAAHAEELLRPGTTLAAANLQWRPDPRAKVPQLTVTETSVFSANPRDAHLRATLNRQNAFLKTNPGCVSEMRVHLEQKLTGGQTTPEARSHWVMTPDSVKSTPVSSRSSAPQRRPTPLLSNPGSTAGTPSSVPDEEDPRVAKKRMVQKQKAYRLEMMESMYASVSPHTVHAGRLNTPVPGTVRRAFKPPSRRAASPIPDDTLTDRSGSSPSALHAPTDRLSGERPPGDTCGRSLLSESCNTEQSSARNSQRSDSQPLSQSTQTSQLSSTQDTPQQSPSTACDHASLANPPGAKSRQSLKRKCDPTSEITTNKRRRSSRLSQIS